MNRRQAIAALAFLGAAAHAGYLPAQPRLVDGRPARIAFTAFSLTPEVRGRINALMRSHGWQENKDYVFVQHSGFKQDFANLKQNAAGAVSLNPDVVVVGSTAAALEVHRLTKSLPIVMLGSGYPVEAGVADSLRRPGKNVTGNSVYAGTGVWGKHLELLRAAKSGVKRVGVLWGYVPPTFPAAEIEPAYVELRNAAAALGLSIHMVEVPTHEQLLAATTAIASTGPDALLISGWLTLGKHWLTVVKLAAERQLPTLTDVHLPAEPKWPRPLLTYGAEQDALWRQTFSYVDRILRGARPGELPIQQPAKFELVVNLQTAKAIGVTVPQSILLRADRVIE